MDLTETILKIGNDPNFIQMVEPKVAFPFQLQHWMVVRCLKALGMLEEEYDNYIRKTKRQTDSKGTP